MLPLDNWTRRVPRRYWLCAALLFAVGIWSAATNTLLAKQGGDGQIDYMPSRAFSAEVFRAGSLPLWDPHIFSGMSHLAVVQAAPFYPINILLYVLFPAPVAFNLAEILHVLLLLGFTHAYLRLFTDHEEAAWLGAVTFSFCGFLMLHIEAVGLFNSAVWIPPLFYCVERWIRERQWRFCAYGGMFLALQLLAGWPQMVLLSAIYVSIMFLFALPDVSGRLQLLGGLLTMGAISAGLGAIEVLPTMAFKQSSNLAVLPFSHFISNSIAPQTLVTLLFPYLMGADYTTHHAVPYFGSAQMVVTAAYVGILPLMLAAAALTLCKASRIVRTSAASAVAAAIFSFGGFTPLGRLLYHTPVFNFFRDHRVNIIFFAFAVATMACHAVGHLEFVSPERRRALTILVPAGLLLLAVGLLIKVRAILGSVNQRIAPFHPQWVYRLHQSMRFGNRDMILAWLTMLAAIVIFWRLAKSPTSRTVARIAVVFVAADLLWFGLSDQPHLSPGKPNAEEQATYDTVRQAAGGEAFRTMAVTPDQEFLRPNLNEIAGVDDIFGYSALVPKDYGDLLPVSVFELPHWRELMANNVILSLLNTRFILASGDSAKPIVETFASGSTVQPDNQPAAAQQELITPGAWTALRPSQRLNPGDPFQCSDPPCGMQQAGLKLEKNSVYQLRFNVQANTRSSDLSVMVAVHDSWQPRQSFPVSNVELPQRETSYLDTYVTGGDEVSDLRFATNYPADVHVTKVSLVRVSGLPSPSPYRPIAQHGDIVVLENQNALPRAFFVPKIERVSGYAEARNRLWDEMARFDARAMALVEGAAGDEDMSVGKVESLSYSPNEAHLNVSCPRRCYLVLADAHLPGWKATVDGEKTSIFRTNAVVRGIYVPAGEHAIEFEYRPRSVSWGLWIMLLTCVIVVVMIAEGKAVPRKGIMVDRGL